MKKKGESQWSCYELISLVTPCKATRIPDSGSWEIFVCGIGNPGQFCLLNPVSRWRLESRIQGPSSTTGIQHLQSGIQDCLEFSHMVKLLQLAKQCWLHTFDFCYSNMRKTIRVRFHFFCKLKQNDSMISKAFERSMIMTLLKSSLS